MSWHTSQLTYALGFGGMMSFYGVVSLIVFLLPPSTGVGSTEKIVIIALVLLTLPFALLIMFVASRRAKKRAKREAEAAAAVAAGNLCGQEPGKGFGPAAAPSPAWKTGPALRKVLDAPISLVWGDREARGAFDSLSRSTGVAIFLDRRVDPGHLLTLKVANEPLRTVLQSAAGQVDAGVALVGAVVYVGPKATAGKLLALATLRQQETGKLPAEVRLRLTKSAAWSWGEPAEPRQLLNDLATRGGVRVENPELVPHDLWPAATWPALAWTERMTLVLAGFELTYELKDSGTIRLVSLPERLVFERTYTPQGDADRSLCRRQPRRDDTKCCRDHSAAGEALADAADDHRPEVARDAAQHREADEQHRHREKEAAQAEHLLQPPR